jgi:hypothetical protein
MAKEKTYVEDIDRSLYDFRNKEGKDTYKLKAGLTREIVEQISDEKNDPEWMRQFRFRSLDIYNKTPMVDWGPAIDGLDMDNIVTYVRDNKKMSANWASPRQSGLPWQASAPSMTPSWFTTTSKTKWQSRALFIPISKARCTARMPT